MKKKILVAILFGVLFNTSNIFAANLAYNELVQVNKPNYNTVYSYSTGTNTYSVAFGGTNTHHHSNIKATVQYYAGNNNYQDYPGSTRNLSADTTNSWNIYASPYKTFRLKLSDSGTGTGWIQGLE